MSGVSGVAQELIEDADVALLGGDELVLDQLAGGHVQLVQALLVVFQAVFFAFLECFEGGGVAEEVGDAGGELGPGTPGAGGIGGFATKLADAVAKSLGGSSVFGLNASPHTAKVRPVRSSPRRSTIFSTSTSF